MSIANYEKVYAPFYPNFSAEQFEWISEGDIDNKQSNDQQTFHMDKKKVFIAFGLATNTKLLLMDRQQTDWIFLRKDSSAEWWLPKSGDG